MHNNLGSVQQLHFLEDFSDGCAKSRFLITDNQSEDPQTDCKVRTYLECQGK